MLSPQFSKTLRLRGPAGPGPHRGFGPWKRGTGTGRGRSGGGGREGVERVLKVSLFLISHCLTVLFASPGPADAFPSDFTSKALGVCLLLRSFVRKGERRRGRGGVCSGLALRSRPAAVCFTKIVWGNPTTSPQRRLKPPPRRSLRPASHLVSYFQKFLCFRESFSIPSAPFALPPHLLPLRPCPRRSQKPLCAQLPARSGAELRGGSQRQRIPGTPEPGPTPTPDPQATVPAGLLNPFVTSWSQNWTKKGSLCEKNHVTHPPETELLERRGIEEA